MKWDGIHLIGLLQREKIALDNLTHEQQQK